MTIRKTIIGILGTLAAIVVAFVVLVGAMIAHDKAEREASKKRIRPTEIELQNLRLKPEFASTHLTGRVLNHSKEYILTDLNIRIRVRDCAQQTDDGSCIIINEATSYLWEKVPPGQARDFDEYTSLEWSQIAPDSREWEYDIVEIRGKRED